MDDKTLARKLAENEKARRRWMTRLTRAHNALTKLERQTRALKAKQIFNGPKPKPGAATVEALPQPAPMPALAAKSPDLVAEAARQITAAGLELPDFLKRGQAAQKAVDKILEKHQLVEELKAKNADKIAADKKKMPLSGRAAMAAVKRKK